MQVVEEHPGGALVADLTSVHSVDEQVMLEYVDDSEGSNTGSFCL